MSRLLKLSGVAVLVTALLVLGAPAKKAQAQPGVSVSFQMFYNSLQPYGQWVDYPQYGYCWVPNVGRDFRPYYSNGHWVMTEYGNTWVSNYDWGWAPFHYGNWTYDEYYGWIWVPGTTWGPAWVSWRNGGGHYGWAPIAPGVSVNVAIGSYNCGPDWWVFVPQRHIYSRSFHNHWRGPRYNNTYINNTTIINNTYINNNQRYVYGPRSQEIQRATGQRVTTYGVRTSNGPGRSQVRGNSLNVYRPNVERRNNERPERYASVNERRGNSPRTIDNSVRNDRPDRAAAVEHNSAARSNEVRSREYNRPSARGNATPQQQERITERRQEAWQQRSQPTRQQPAERNNEVQRQRPQYNNRSVERARPQPQRQAAPQRSMQRSAPQRSEPVQRATPQRSMQRSAPQRSEPAQRAARPSGNMQRSAPANRGRSSNDKWR
ncbi:MAG TPA: DUF6600 domain-containing protein [Flavipsychrobacter sp.]